jgi:hydroxymethylbilane synthase
MAMRTIRIGTRGSKLALTQAGWVKRKLADRHPGLKVEIVTIKTSGDRFLETPIQAVGGKGVFVKEIEDALSQGKIDLAVHSMKDLPTEVPSGLIIAAIPVREDPRDVLVTSNHKALQDLSPGAKIGTGSLRRQAQILHYRPDLVFSAVRGNIDTRLKKLDRGEMDGLIMAAAGLKRIGLGNRVSEYLPPDICLSAVAQGALGLESREGDQVVSDIEFLHHLPTAMEILAERSFLRRLGGGCQIPVGARAWMDERQVRLMGVIAAADGKRIFKGEVSGSADEAEKLGQELAERLLGEGADQVLSVEQNVVREKGFNHVSR